MYINLLSCKNSKIKFSSSSDFIISRSSTKDLMWSPRLRRFLLYPGFDFTITLIDYQIPVHLRSTYTPDFCSVSVSFFLRSHLSSSDVFFDPTGQLPSPIVWSYPVPIVLQWRDELIFVFLIWFMVLTKRNEKGINLIYGGKYWGSGRGHLTKSLYEWTESNWNGIFY